MHHQSTKPALTRRQTTLLLALGLGSTLLCVLAITNFFIESLLQKRYLLLYLLMAAATMAMLRLLRSMRR